ncbi:MAG: PIG-L family deacetylase [Parcubacteria group bacterium]|nr:PIG-L family deacetylase [Parcubacteria group bacterium]
MISLRNQVIFIVSPHPDDEVLGCGGLIHKAKNNGARVYVLYLTVGTTKDFSQTGISTGDERIQEVMRVADYLRLDGYAFAFPGDEYHLKLDAIPQKDIIHAIERGGDISLQSVNPTMLLFPQAGDYNQDPRVAATAALAATRPTPPEYKSLQRIVASYEYPPSTWTVESSQTPPNLFIELSEVDLASKVEALSLYASQLKNPNGPLSVKAVKELAQMRGIQSGVPYAEAYTLKRFLS